MKIYNYSDTPVTINGTEISDTVIILPSQTRKPFVKHNGFEFTSNQNQESRNEIYTIINGTSTGSYKYMTDSIEVPNVWAPVSLFVTVFGFLIIIKIAQKLKTR
jgi:hypothetical protein